jgi:hypothetical protein
LNDFSAILGMEPERYTAKHLRLRSIGCGSQGIKPGLPAVSQGNASAALARVDDFMAFPVGSSHPTTEGRKRPRGRTTYA